MSSAAAFFRLEGALHPDPAWSGAMWLASNAPRVRSRLAGVGSVALSASLSWRDPAITQRLTWQALRGMSRDRVEVLGADWAEDQSVKIRPEAALLVDEANAAGFRLVLIAETIAEIAEPFAQRLGFAEVICNRLVRHPDGAASGELASPRIGPAMDPKWLRAWAQQRDIDLLASRAYGAHRHDAVLLTLVGYPCAIEPDGELGRVARSLDWPVVRSAAAMESTLGMLPGQRGMA